MRVDACWGWNFIGGIPTGLIDLRAMQAENSEELWRTLRELIKLDLRMIENCLELVYRKEDSQVQHVFISTYIAEDSWFSDILVRNYALDLVRLWREDFPFILRIAGIGSTDPEDATGIILDRDGIYGLLEEDITRAAMFRLVLPQPDIRLVFPEYDLSLDELAEKAYREHEEICPRCRGG